MQNPPATQVYYSDAFLRNHERMWPCFSLKIRFARCLREQCYIATDEIATTLFLAERLNKPVLAEGPAGVGKTELAKAWAAPPAAS